MTPAPARVFYGWWIAATFAAVVFLSAGLRFPVGPLLKPTALILLALLGGTSMSGTQALGSALTADIFGRFSVGSVFGTMFLLHQVGAALGSWLGGLMFELTGGYGAAFAMCCVLLGVGSLLSLAVDVRPCPARLATAGR